MVRFLTPPLFSVFAVPHVTHAPDSDDEHVSHDVPGYWNVLDVFSPLLTVPTNHFPAGTTTGVLTKIPFCDGGIVHTVFAARQALIAAPPSVTPSVGAP
ncbi:hypothetical protein WT56_00365 [Burkholderia pseudomultivorans]|uniref:Uncharacterized protein n=1 Tax=Burkholderia pseudomultivorans TaxID=1207504 RepID=A0A132EE23_9BURK|nr:hypothetical protein WT56_00365 [Burkholderia pseudomultivorans]